jgi:predicted aconitase with swiveling domain
MGMKIEGRIIKYGEVEGETVVSNEPIGFLGGVDPETGIVIEKGHPLEGKSIKGKVLVFSTGKGSTVGSYILYRMKKNNVAPLAIINEECEPITAVGAIISNIPCVDKIKINVFKTGDKIRIEGEKVFLNE